MKNGVKNIQATGYNGAEYICQRWMHDTHIRLSLMNSILFLRTRLKTAGLLFAIYLMMNGTERFFIEKIRVNTTFDLMGITMTQAELISTALFLGGAILFYILNSRRVPTKNKKLTVWNKTHEMIFVVSNLTQINMNLITSKKLKGE